MTIPQPRSGLLTLGLALLLTACSHTPPTSSPEQQQQLLENLLSQTVYTNTLFSQCETLGDDVELEALNVQQDWLQKNWPLIAAADDYYTRQQQTEGLLYGGQLISLHATRLTHDARQKALDELNFSQRTTINQQRFCMNRLKKIAREELDLAAGLDHSRLPFNPGETDSGNIQSGSIQIDAIPTLAFKTPVVQTPGRTWFVLEDGFKQTCAQPRKLVLFNDWPRETYAIYCDQAPLALMVCEWGQCERRQE